jgi:PAS domain-containing protein
MKMNVISIPVVAMASVTVYVGFYHLLIYLKRWQLEDLTFALTCFLIGLYDLLSAGLYNATSAAEGVRWQHAQAVALALASIAFLWFVDYYTSKVPRLAKFALSTVYLLAAVITAVDRSGLVWSDRPAIKVIHLSSDLAVTYYEMASGPVVDLVSLVGVALFICFVSAGIRLYRDGARRRAAPFIVAMVFFFIGVFNDSAVASGLYEFVYLMEYAYLAIMLLMTFSLTQRVVDAAIVQEELDRERDLVAHIMETSPVGIVVVDRNGQITFANPRAEEIFGLSRDEVGERTFNAPEWHITDFEGNPFPEE